jgi:hypothetical protein
MAKEQFHTLKALIGDSAIGEISSSDMHRLVQFSRSIVEAYLRNVRASVTNVCLYQGLTVTDAAYDCLGEAFARDDTNSFFRLRAFADSFGNPFAGIYPDEVFFSYKNFLTRIADAHLARLYAQADPEYSSILRNIREALKGSDIF